MRDFLDKSLYSLAPYRGGSSSMLSPSITAQQPITPCSGNHQVEFEFPEDLVPPAAAALKENLPILPPGAAANPNTRLQVEVVTSNKDTFLEAPNEGNVNRKSFLYRKLAGLKSSSRSVLTLSTNASTHTPTTHNNHNIRRDALIPLSPRLYQPNILIDANSASADINPKVSQYKQRRKQYRMAATAGGMVVGGLALGPAGIVVGAGVGLATNKVCKVKEKRAQRKFEQKNFQLAASQSIVAQSQEAFC